MPSNSRATPSFKCLRFHNGAGRRSMSPQLMFIFIWAAAFFIWSAPYRNHYSQRVSKWAEEMNTRQGLAQRFENLQVQQETWIEVDDDEYNQ